MVASFCRRLNSSSRKWLSPQPDVRTAERAYVRNGASFLRAQAAMTLMLCKECPHDGEGRGGLSGDPRVEIAQQACWASDIGFILSLRQTECCPNDSVESLCWLGVSVAQGHASLPIIKTFISLWPVPHSSCRSAGGTAATTGDQ